MRLIIGPWRYGTIWRGHSSSSWQGCLWRRNHDAMVQSYQQETVKALSNFLTVRDVFMWHGLGPYALFPDHLHPFIDSSMYTNTDGSLSCRTMCRVIEASCLKVLWKLSTSDIAIILAQNEPNQTFIGCGEDAYSHVRSCTSKYRCGKLLRR